jgi:predicted dithiol-disulfide oxidoreductase (DUF899 family)
VSREEWLDARRALLVKEKDATRARDALSKERRALPVVKIDKSYEFESLDGGKLKLLDLFEGRRQLIVYHFMFSPEEDEGCSACSLFGDSLGHLSHLQARDTTFAAISRAPVSKIGPFRERLGWTFPWYSSGDGDFNYDFNATMSDSRPQMFDFMSKAEKERMIRKYGKDFTFDMHGLSVFLRDGTTIYHSYSTYDRGTDQLVAVYNMLDLTPLGRQEEGTDISGFQYHDKYTS